MKGDDLKPIKEIAGRLLLYFYYTQRTDPVKLQDSIFSFQMRHFSEEKKTSPALIQANEDMKSDIRDMNITDSDLYNALLYLNGKYFISMSDSHSNMSDSFHNVIVEPGGVDVIEGIERGVEERRQFNITFNIKVENNTNIESLLKANLGSIFSGAGISI